MPIALEVPTDNVWSELYKASAFGTSSPNSIVSIVCEEEAPQTISDKIAHHATAHPASGSVAYRVSIQVDSYASDDWMYKPFSHIEDALPGKSLSSLEDEWSHDPEWQELLKEARKDLASESDQKTSQTLAALRLQAGLSQRELAKLAGVEQYQISKLEAGKGMSLTNLKKVWLALNVDGNAFMNAL